MLWATVRINELWEHRLMNSYGENSQSYGTCTAYVTTGLFALIKLPKSAADVNDTCAGVADEDASDSLICP
jgi:hypothetical protein